jgi:hypothetical protein
MVRQTKRKRERAREEEDEGQNFEPFPLSPFLSLPPFLYRIFGDTFI